MKKNLLIILLTGLSVALLAQAPQAFNFQTIVRNEAGQVVPLQDVTFHFAIRLGDPGGEIIYKEQHLASTNSQGLVSVAIGSGEVLEGTFDQIDWGNEAYFLEEQIDIGNTGNFQVFGTVQLLSVPYALHANTAGNGIQSMTTEERDEIENPNVGMQIFNTTTNCLNYWNGTNWFETCGECTPQPDNANAGADQSYNDSTTVVTLNANSPDFGTGIWTKSNFYQGWFEDPADPNTIFHGEPCNYVYLKWTISNNCGSDYDYVKITFDHTPSEAIAGQDITIHTEEISINLNAEIPEEGLGVWAVINGNGGSFTDENDPNTLFTGLPCTAYDLKWRVFTECYSNADTVSIEFDAIPTAPYA
nr:hypothetical protein [Bacteroidota bacterium]